MCSAPASKPAFNRVLIPFCGARSLAIKALAEYLVGASLNPLLRGEVIGLGENSVDGFASSVLIPFCGARSLAAVHHMLSYLRGISLNPLLRGEVIGRRLCERTSIRRRSLNPLLRGEVIGRGI